MDISTVVTVNISRETANVSQVGFNTLLIVGPNCNVDNRLEYFTSAVAALAKITGADTREEAMVLAAFGQNPAPSRIALGGLSASRTAVFSGTYSAGAISCGVNGEEVSQTFSSTLDDTITALAVKIAATDDVSTAVYTANTNTLVITPATGKNVGINFDLTGITGGGLEVVVTSTELAESYSTALSAILIEQPDWYGIAAATQTIAKQELIAQWAEANKKFYFCGSADANIVNTTLANDSTSIAALTKAQSLTKTAVIYGVNAATEGNDAALAGKLLPMDPGTYTAKFKTLALITADSLTPTQTANATAKKANTYQPCGGVNMVLEGTVGEGEYIDVMIFIDWLQANIQTGIFAALKKVKKVAFTDAGIAIVQAAVSKPLQIGIDRGALSPMEKTEDGVQVGGYVVNVPKAADVATADKTARLLQDLTFTAWLAGAIHLVQVDGVVTL